MAGGAGDDWYQDEGQIRDKCQFCGEKWSKIIDCEDETDDDVEDDDFDGCLETSSTVKKM